MTQPTLHGLATSDGVKLEDADLDLMHHALGCPEGRWVKPYRNYFAIDADTPTARRFMETGRWIAGGQYSGGMTSYRVTPEGIAEVFDWLDAKHAAKKLRLYVVSYDWGEGIERREVLAKSPAAARYARFLHIADIWPDGFADWLKQMKPTVRLAAINTAPPPEIPF
jgi:hypothetical protein